MKRTSVVLIAAMIFFVAHSSVVAQEGGDAILGKWLTARGKSHVQVYRCGERYCGKIVWLKEPLDENGQPKKDHKNKDETKRDRPLMGINLVWGFTYDGRNWIDGRIYDPENGKTYKCKMILEGTELKVRGYAGPFYRTTLWTKL